MIVLRVEPGISAARSLTKVKLLATVHPGNERLVILAGAARIELGAEWAYSGSLRCLAALKEFGDLQDPPTTGGT